MSPKNIRATLTSLETQNEVARIHLQYFQCIDNCTDNWRRQLTDIFAKSQKSAPLNGQTKIIAEAMNNYKKTMDSVREYLKAYTSTCVESATELTTRWAEAWLSFLNKA